MKINFKALLVSLMSVAVLTGCGSANVEDLSVVPLETAVVGETIDLKDYVNIEGDTDKFSAELLTKDTAKLEGTKLKLLKEGDVTVYITAGDKEAVLTFSAISRIKNSYREFTKDIEDKFFIGTVSSSAGKTVYSEDGWIFNEQYGAMDYSFFEKNGGYEAYIYGDEVYVVKMDDREGTNAELQLGSYSSLYYEPQTFNLNFSLFSTELYNLTEYCLKAGEDVVADFCSLISVNSGVFRAIVEEEGYQYVETKLIVRMVDKSNEKVPVFSFELNYIAGGAQRQQEMGDRFYLSNDPDLYTIPALQEMIDEGVTPAQPELNDLYAKTNEIVAAKNYTLNVNMRWYDKNKNNTTTPVLDGGTSNDELWNTILELFSRESKQIAYVTETEALFKETENRRNTAISGRYDHYYEKEGKLYNSSNYTESGDEIVLTTASEKEAGQGTVWNNSKALGLIDAFATNSTAKENANVVYVKTANATEDYDYVFSGANSGVDMLAAIVSLAPFYGSELATAYSGTNIFVKPPFELFMMHAYTYINSDSLKFEILFRWDTDHTFEMVYEFTNVGTTTIPTL